MFWWLSCSRMVQVDIGKWRYRTSKDTALAPFINVFTGCDSDMSSHQRSDYVFNWVPKATSVYFQSGAYGCLSMTPVQVLMLQTKMFHTPTVYPGCGRGNESRLSLQGVWIMSDKWLKSLNIMNFDIIDKTTLIHLPIHPFIHLSKLSINSRVHPYTYASIYPLKQSSIHLFIHLSIHQSDTKKKKACHFCHFLRIFPT